MSRSVFETLEGRRHLDGLPGPDGPPEEFGSPFPIGPGDGRSGPTAELVTDTRTEPGTDSFVFHVIYRDTDGVAVASLDDTDLFVRGPDDIARRAVFLGTDKRADATEVVARYKFAPPGGAWNASDNGAYLVELRADQVFDTSGTAGAPGTFGELHVDVDGGPDNVPEVGLFGLDPAQFGAFPNDGIDDTAAIQAAIDFLPRGNGVPIGSTPAGGIVLLREGVYDTSFSLYVHSGVTVRGAGAATVVRNRGPQLWANVFALYSPFTHRFNVGVTIDRMTIISQNGAGIGIDPNMNGDVQDLRLSNLRISTSAPAINLREERVYYSEIDNVEVFNPGSLAVRLGSDTDGSNHNNRIRNLRVTGTARPDFRPETALVSVNADVLIQGLEISTRGANILPLLLRGRMTLNGLTLDVPAADCPGGVAVVFDGVRYALIDELSGVGEGRRLQLLDTYIVDVGVMHSDGTTNILSRLADVDETSYLRVGNAAKGRLHEDDQQLNGEQGPGVLPPPVSVLDSRDYGVVPNDGVDDTDELQAAIDALPAYNAATLTGGGIVQLPLGIVNVSDSIRLPSGVWLRGHNNGTTLQNATTVGFNRAVIELTSRSGDGRNIGAGVIEVGLRGEYCSAIRPDETVYWQVGHLRLQDLRLKVGARGVDLRSVQVTNSVIDRIVMTDPATTAIWLGRWDNVSYGNVVRAFRVMGLAPGNFVPEAALFIYHGATRVESGSIEDTLAPVLPLYAAGPKFTMLDTYMEYPQQADGIGYVFDRVADGYVSHLWHVDPQRKVYVTGNSRLRIGTLNITGYTTELRQNTFVEGGSHLTLDSVLTQFDAGLLDHPAVSVRGVYGVRARRYVDTRDANGGSLLADPNMLDVADDRIASWTIYWGDTLGWITGNWAVETANGVKRLRLTVLNNPNNRKVSVQIKLRVPANAVGKQAVGSWRVDGNGPAIAWRGYYDGEYQARVTNSLTAMTSPRPIVAEEMLWIDLPAAQGTYYLSKVGVVPVWES